MISSTSAHTGEEFVLSFFSDSTGLAVTASVVFAEDDSSSDVTLTEKSAFSTDDRKVYTGTYTPASAGWYFVQYVARDSSNVIQGTTVSRFYAATASATEAASTSVITENPSEGGTSTSVPKIIEGTAGTLAFSVRSS
jgi:hypothetical protein